MAMAIALALAAGPAIAQDSRHASGEEERSMQRRPTETTPGQTAQSAIGQVGQRQRRDDLTSIVNPTQRVATRIQNRVQTRIRNRLDRYYDARPDVSSPFVVADESARGQRRAPRRQP